MFVGFLEKVFREHTAEPFMVHGGREFSYQWLLDAIQSYRERIARGGIAAGDVVVMDADYTPNAVAAFLALADHAAVVVPLSRGVDEQKDTLIRISGGAWSFALNRDDHFEVRSLDGNGEHELYTVLRGRGHPGLVVFSSGSTGEPKGAVHDLVGILEKFQVRRHRMTTIPFLLFDHLGGLNTMLYSLSNGGCQVTVAERTPDAILAAVARHGVELLPTSPTFLNLMLLSEAHRRHDLSSLRTISYGTEPMPESTLRRLHELFPDKRLLQTYGLSEVGVLRSRSRDSGSLWVKVGGEGFETRVVDGLLQIKARSAMLGYLNADSPFTDDGWFMTGDEVEVDGDWLRILGRRSDLINVGGQKVYPAEVESVILDMPEIADATVYGEKNPILGTMVCADVTPGDGAATPEGLATQVQARCREQLARFKVPVKVNVVDQQEYQLRFKKSRRPRNQP